MKSLTIIISILAVSLVGFTFVMSLPCYSAEKEEGLVLYLSFDEGGGTVAKDLSGNGYDGKVNKAEYVDGKVGKALQFTMGKSTFVEVPSQNAFNIIDAVTLAAWIKPNVPFDPVWRGIINTRKSTHGPHLLQTAANSVGEVGFWIGGAWVWAQTGVPLTRDFAHLVGTYDKKDGGKIYLNGKLNMGNTNMSKGTPIDKIPNEGVVIGHDYGMGNRWWDGIIDEVAIYNRALSEAEVKDLFDGKIKAKIAAVDPQRKLAITWGEMKKK